MGSAYFTICENFSVIYFFLTQVLNITANLKDMNEYPTKRKRKTSHLSTYSDSSGISRIADGFNGIFSDHCYSVCSMRQPDLKYFDNKGIFKFSKIFSFKLLL